MGQASRQLRRESQELLYLLDSTSITLKGPGFDAWTQGNSTRNTQGIKLHLLYAAHEQIPCSTASLPPTSMTFRKVSSYRLSVVPLTSLTRVTATTTGGPTLMPSMLASSPASNTTLPCALTPHGPSLRQIATRFWKIRSCASPTDIRAVAGAIATRSHSGASSSLGLTRSAL